MLMVVRRWLVDHRREVAVAQTSTMVTEAPLSGSFEISAAILANTLVGDMSMHLVVRMPMSWPCTGPTRPHYITHQ